MCDSMNLNNIIDMSVIKENLSQNRYISYHLVTDGFTPYRGKEVSIISFEKAKSIFLEESNLKGYLLIIII